MPPSFFRNPEIPYFESRYSQASSTCYGLHSHTTVSIGLIVSGQAVIEVANEKISINQGDIVMFNPGQAHACNPLENKQWAYHMLYFDQAWWQQTVKELTAENISANFQSAVITAPKLCKELSKINEGLFESITGSNFDDFELQLIIWINRFLSELEPAEIAAKERGTPPEWIEHVKHFLEENVAQVVKLKSLCEISQQPMTQLIRRFKFHCGLTPYAYLQNHRINKAKEMLAKGAVIADVALELGFADQSHLHRLFKRLVACTPKRYQQTKR